MLCHHQGRVLLLCLLSRAANACFWGPNGAAVNSFNETVLTGLLGSVQTFRDARRYLGSHLTRTAKGVIAKVYDDVTTAELSSLIAERGELRFTESDSQTSSQHALAGVADLPDCRTPMDRAAWAACCSIIPQETTCPNLTTPICCDIGEANTNSDFLPFLEELELVLRLPVDDEPTMTKRLRLDQEGALRPFDVASILWPAGYILTLCVSAPVRCGIPELAAAPRRVLELGAGIGAPTSALSYAVMEHELVVADLARHSLALARDNVNPSRRNSTKFILMDHFNSTNVKDLQRWHGQFDFVLGASLASLYDDASQLQSVLQSFVHPVTGIAVLAQAIDTMPVLDKFAVVHTVSSTTFGMLHPQHLDAEFEIVVLRPTGGTDEL